MRYEDAEYGQNEELLETSMLKSQLKRWKNKKYSIDHIIARLWEIHLIKVKKKKIKKLLNKL